MSWVGILYDSHTKATKFGSNSLVRAKDLGAPSSTSSYTPPLGPRHAVYCVKCCNLTKSDCGGIQFYPLNKQEIRCISGLISNPVPDEGIEKSLSSDQAQIPGGSDQLSLVARTYAYLPVFSVSDSYLSTRRYHGRAAYSKAFAGL